MTCSWLWLSPSEAQPCNFLCVRHTRKPGFEKFFEQSFLGISHKSFLHSLNIKKWLVNLDCTSFRPASPKVLFYTWPSWVWHDFPFVRLHKSFRTKPLNQLVLFLDSPFIQLAAAVNKVLMSSSAILLSQCFLVEVPFFQGFLQRQRKKNFFFLSASGWTWQGCQLSTTDCEMHRDGLDPSHLLFSSRTRRQS